MHYARDWQGSHHGKDIDHGKCWERQVEGADDSASVGCSRAHLDSLLLGLLHHIPQIRHLSHRLLLLACQRNTHSAADSSIWGCSAATQTDLANSNMADTRLDG